MHRCVFEQSDGCAEVSRFYQTECDRPICDQPFAVTGKMSRVLMGLCVYVHRHTHTHKLADT